MTRSGDDTTADDIAGVTLALDASTYEGSVAVLRDGRIAAERVVAMRGEREERLMPAVAATLAEAGAAPSDLARIVCGAGPGAFTPLRIAGAIAKGLSTATGAPLFAVSSLALAALHERDGSGQPSPGRWLVALDALRGDVFAAAYEWDGRELLELRAESVVARDDLAAVAASLGASVVDAVPRAGAVAFVLSTIVSRGPVDLGSWAPTYGRLAEAQVRWEAAHGRPLRT